MTIQEYINVAVKGVPKEDFLFYEPYFLHMGCEHCFYNGYACQNPGNVCIEYRVEKKDMEFVKPNTRYEKKVRSKMV